MMKIFTPEATTWFLASMLFAGTALQLEQPSLSQETSDYLAAMHVSGGHWPTTGKPLRIYISPAQATPDQITAVKEAFAQWAGALTNRLTFSYVNVPSQANILVKWSKKLSYSSFAEDGEARCFWGPKGIERAEITMLIPGKETASSITKRTALHEIGHALGLCGHSDSANDLMAPTLAVAGLSQRDIASIQHLYRLPAKNASAASAQAEVPYEVRLLNNEASALIDRGRYDEAIDKLKQALKLAPTYSFAQENLCSAYYNLGVALYQKSDYQRALTPLKEALRLDNTLHTLPANVHSSLEDAAAQCAQLQGSAREVSR